MFDILLNRDHPQGRGLDHSLRRHRGRNGFFSGGGSVIEHSRVHHCLSYVLCSTIKCFVSVFIICIVFYQKMFFITCIVFYQKMFFYCFVSDEHVVEVGRKLPPILRNTGRVARPDVEQKIVSTPRQKWRA